MPSLANHHSNEFTKLLLEGDSGSGKTGALTSLVEAGYSLRILDMDNGLETLKTFVGRQCPDKLSNVEYRTLRDKYKASPLGPILAGPPKAFVDAIKMLDRWKYDDVDLGVPAEWGQEVILVVDSLTFLSDSAFEWAVGLNPSAKDPRQWYGAAQEAIEKVLALLSSSNFETNVIVISHIKYMETPEGPKGYPTAVGSALSPVIPRYFNSVAMCRTKPGGKRMIQTATTGLVDLKNPKPFEMQKEYELETGLADFFGVLRKPPATAKAQPKQETKIGTGTAPTTSRPAGFRLQATKR